MKRIVISSLVVLFGIVVVAGGFSKLGSGSTATCGGKVMHAGDECVSTSVTGAETGRSSADDQRKSEQGTTWVAMGAGVLMIVFGAKSLVTGIRNRRRPNVPEPAASAQQPAGSVQYPHPNGGSWAPPVPGQPMPPGFQSPQPPGPPTQRPPWH